MIYILDFGYCAFYRYHAAKRYFSFKDEIYDLENAWLNVQEFRECLLKQIEKMIKKFSNKNKNKVYIACESLNGSKNWRREIYPEYKGTRKHNPDVYQYMKYLYDDYLPKLSNEYITILRSDCEADDLIALKTKELVNEEVIIISSDHDFLQLVEEDNTVILMDAKGNNIATKKRICGKKYLKSKIIDGDKSDNIPSILQGKNKKKNRDNLLNKLESIENLDDVDINVFDGDENLFKRFQLNRLLIDFDKLS